MTIRNMQIQDYDKVFAIWRSCKGMGLNALDDSRDGIAHFLQRNPETCLVACSGQEILGVILGVGAQLVDAVLQAFQRLGIRKVALVAFAQNEAGNAFWETQGFTVREDLIYRNRALVQLPPISADP